MSETLNELATALAKAQAEMHGAAKDSENPYFKSRYADGASVWDAARGPLTKHGLSVVQLPSTVENNVTVKTILLHSSGQSIAGELSAQAKDAAPQSIGSCITYLRRYGLQSMVQVWPEDDDGHQATHTAPPKQTAKATAKQAAKPPASSMTLENAVDRHEFKQLVEMLAVGGCTKGNRPEQNAVIAALGFPGETIESVHGTIGLAGKVFSAMSELNARGESINEVCLRALKAAGLRPQTQLEKEAAATFG